MISFCELDNFNFPVFLRVLLGSVLREAGTLFWFPRDFATVRRLIGEVGLPYVVHSDEKLHRMKLRRYDTPAVQDLTHRDDSENLLTGLIHKLGEQDSERVESRRGAY